MTNSFGPASAEPTGAPSPLLKQTETVSKCSRPLAGGDAGGDDGVPEPGAVEVHDQAVLARPGADRLDLLERIDAAAAAVVRVLQADQPGADHVDR